MLLFAGTASLSFAADATPKGKAYRAMLGCFPLLVAAEDSGRIHASLDLCDVSLELSGDPDNPDVTLRMQADAAASWRERFDTPGPAADALAQGQIRVMPASDEIVQNAILVDAQTSPATDRETWRWDRRQGTLSSRNFRADSSANWYRVCDATLRNVSAILAMRVNLASGSVFSGSLIKPAPWGQPNSVPKQCASAWQVSAGAPAIIHPQWGIGMVSADAREGDRFEVQVRVGDKTLRKEVRVYVSALHPLVGSWRQIGERACDATELRKPAVPISELLLRPDGSFDMTWLPLNHHYIDYSGTYSHDRNSAAFAWAITGGQAPAAQIADAGRSGRAQLNKAGQLVISGLHPGSKTPGEERLCELVFQKSFIGQ